MNTEHEDNWAALLTEVDDMAAGAMTDAQCLQHGREARRHAEALIADLAAVTERCNELEAEALSWRAMFREARGRIEELARSSRSALDECDAAYDAVYADEPEES